MKDISDRPRQSINFREQITCIDLSPYEWSQNLVCVALKHKIVLMNVKFPEDTETGSFEYKKLKELLHEHRCHAISIAPHSCLAAAATFVKFCTADADFLIRMYRTDLQENDTIQVLSGHTGYINSIAWEPEGKFLASASDDHTCMITSWNENDDGNETIVFYLKSAGMSVCWHTEDTGKLLVAEKKGVIHMYNAISQQIILSIESSKSPLMCADWAQSNRFHIVALIAGEVIFYDLRRPSRPIEIKAIHENGGRFVKFSPHSESWTASIGQPNSLKVIHIKSQIPQLDAFVKLSWGRPCWHYRLPYIAVGEDCILNFYKIYTK